MSKTRRNASMVEKFIKARQERTLSRPELGTGAYLRPKYDPAAQRAIDEFLMRRQPTKLPPKKMNR